MESILTKEFITGQQNQENGVRAGWKQELGLWFPHDSAEKGKKTIGYGHKLSAEEEETFKNGITDEEVQKLYQRDLQIAWKLAKAFYENSYGSFETEVSIEAQQVLVDIAFNIGGKVTKFKNLIEAAHNGNVEVMKGECLTSYKEEGKQLKFYLKGEKNSE